MKKYELLDDNVSYIFDNMIKDRNTISHGRLTYQKVFMRTLSPFFNLAKDSYENTEYLLLLTAVMISRNIGIKRWEKEWIENKNYLMPS